LSKASFHFITLFPETIDVWLRTSILGRAHQAGLFDYELIQLRDFAHNKHSSVDDSSYGGGGGMVLKVEPLVLATESVKKRFPNDELTTIYFSPAGTPLTQELVQKTVPKNFKRFILICGHYEGVDQRFIDHWVDQEISLGDFVITGGELPAVAFTDALIRQLDGTLGAEGGHKTESFLLESEKGKLLEYPQFTRPVEFRGLPVPEVLLSGDHQAIADWRKAQSIDRTERRRPDLLNS
jgi:tRNA (guanine37-N1)-methyltransferase